MNRYAHTLVHVYRNPTTCAHSHSHDCFNAYIWVCAIVLMHIFVCVLGSPFPKNYLSVVKKILKRLFRVFVHVYIHHFDKLVAMGAVSTCFWYVKYILCLCIQKVLIGIVCDFSFHLWTQFRWLHKCSCVASITEIQVIEVCR